MPGGNVIQCFLALSHQWGCFGSLKGFQSHLTVRANTNIRGWAGNSIARPGRKQATATKLGIYSTYSPRSSIHFLALALTFASHSKKIRRLSVQPGIRGRIYLHDGPKMATFQSFFQSREQVVVRRGQIRRTGWVIKTLEAQVGQLLLDCTSPVSRGFVVQEQETLGDLPRCFSFKISLNCTSRDK